MIASNFNFSGHSANCPDSMAETSRISSINASRCFPLHPMSPTYSLYPSLITPKYSTPMASENPMIALSGVLRSWLTAARKFDLSRLAASASARADSASALAATRAALASFNCVMSVPIVPMRVTSALSLKIGNLVTRKSRSSL
ncbi:MAG: hypothetical protein VW268_13080 [Rhodospirillaceae bacterium]